MSTHDAPFFIGIDLGTTNTALAFSQGDARASGGVGNGAPMTFEVPQLVADGEVARRPTLPSFAYLPLAQEEPGMALPWAPGGAGPAVGELARVRGIKAPARVVSSAKSWLSHSAVDRHAPILPWQSPDEVPGQSPVAMSAAYLAHLRAAFLAEHGADLAAQNVVLTVPASFDAEARALTEEAARTAGLGQPVLLEEPQAALYAWLADHADSWRDQLSVGDTILVVDIGGGTTDFSLITVAEADGELELTRLAVGQHILLGGDNMDLALAWRVRMRLEAVGHTIDDWQVHALTHSTRQAKERLLADSTLESVPVVVPSRGRQLVGGALRSELTRGELDETLLLGFFPGARIDARPEVRTKVGLTTLGLPYADDAAITRHLAAFLCAHAPDGATGPDGQPAFVHPTAILFNGGVTKADVVRDRVAGAVNRWLKKAGASQARVLEGDHPDLAVARGAAYYARVRAGGGVRIKGGTARAYYIGIERAEMAIPGIPPRVDAVCVAPFGMEEGEDAALPDAFGLVVGEPVEFRFFSATARPEDAVGTRLPATSGDLVEASPLSMAVDPAGRAPGTVVPVTLHARVTEIGTLDVYAREQGTGAEHRFAFEIRTT